MNLIFFGPPGAGKGTQSELLVDRLSMVQISTGDLFRRAIKEGTPLGREAKSFMDAGKLVPDSVTIGLVEEKLKNLGQEKFILDGFPRNVAQADALSEILVKLGLKIDRTLFLEVPLDQLTRRLVGRRVCKSCGAVYHVDNKPPMKEGECDICGGEVIQRADDKEEVITTRLKAYEDNTKPLKEYYRAKGNYVEINGTGSTEEVYGQITKALQVKAH
ncbi:MAG: adenylate kinase [Bdellovibrionales bacterium]